MVISIVLIFVVFSSGWRIPGPRGPVFQLSLVLALAFNVPYSCIALAGTILAHFERGAGLSRRETPFFCVFFVYVKKIKKNQKKKEII